jgi:hypothetical protein
MRSGGRGKNELSANDTANSARSAFGLRAADIMLSLMAVSMGSAASMVCAKGQAALLRRI